MSSNIINSSKIAEIRSTIFANIPNSWIQSSLGECFNWGSGGTPKSGTKEYYGGNIPWLVIGDLNDGIVNSSSSTITNLGIANSSAKLVKKGTLLLAMYGSIGKLGIAGKDLATNQAIAFCNSKHNYNLFLFYYVIYSRRWLNELGKGATQKNISQTVIKSFPYIIPPLNEQYRIVKKIEELFSELDNGIAALKTAREQLKVYRQSVLKQAFEGKLTAKWREENADKLESPEQLLTRIRQEREARYQQQIKEWKLAVKDWKASGNKGRKPSKPIEPPQIEPVNFPSSHYLSSLPYHWVCVTAKNLCDFITKGTTPPKKELFSDFGEVPFIKVYNLTKTGNLDFSIDPTYVDKNTHNGSLNRSKVFPGDVLINIVGPPLGKVSIVPSTFKEWNINQAIAFYRTNTLKSKLLASFLLFESTVNYMMSQSKATAGQFNLTLEICRNLPIPVCSPAEQDELLNILDQKLTITNALECDISNSLAKAEKLRQSILKKAFSGQLVPQDPNDEPASELLARIQAEKAAQKPTKGHGRKPSREKENA